jgi:glutathione S-transferase
MITLHALKYSRATRVLWLLEDLGQPCKRVDYNRTDAFRAPASLARVHPLGKSPVIEDNGMIIAESATILRYLAAKYNDVSHQPPVGSVAFWQHEALLDYVEGSFAGVALRAILPAMKGEPVPVDAKAALDRHLSYVGDVLGDGPLLFGEDLTLADIQISYLMAMLDTVGMLTGHSAVAAYWQALQTQRGYIAATRAAGPMAPPDTP